MTIPRIIVNHLSFHREGSNVSFNNISISFESLKYGIVGENGVGKTTFLNLLNGQLPPNSGTIQSSGTIRSLPQSHSDFPTTARIQDVLGVSEIIAALEHINEGSCKKEDFDMASEKWDIKNRIEIALRKFNLWPININALFSSLSGGQKTKILLAKTLLFSADFLLFDEPTNNLDKPSRDILYDYIDNSSKGMLIVSHDRTLLNKMDRIIEITTKGIHIFGGNYDLYREEKRLALQALQRDYKETKRTIKKIEHNIQSSREKHEQKQSKGKQERKSTSQAKIILNAMQSRSEKTQSKMAIKKEHVVKDKQSKLSSIQGEMEIKRDLNLSLNATCVASSKVVLDIDALVFKYPDENQLLIDDFSLQIVGPERIAIIGPNGSGKSTLIKLIRKQLHPLRGTIKLGVDHVAHLDQEVKCLDRNLSLVDNFLKLNPEAKPFDAYSALATFNFRNKDAEKKVASLSGGERMRAGLAINLLSKHPPQLIILDEPTNHLDLISIEAVESMLKLYQGAILAVSHDENFLKNIGIKKSVGMDI